MSARVAAVAVAVQARTGPAYHSRTLASSPYDGRKSWPHCEMQCASSTASTHGRIVRSRTARKSSVAAISGVTYTNW